MPTLKLLSSHNFSSKVGKLRLHLPLTLKTSECKTHVVIGSFFSSKFLLDGRRLPRVAAMQIFEYF